MNNVILVVLILNGSGNGEFVRSFPMESMAECLTAVKEARTDVPTGGDAEQGVAIFCSHGEATG